MTTAAVITVGRETFDVAFGEEKAAKAHEVLERLDLDVVGDRKMATGPDAMQQRVDAALAADPDLILLIQATFADASPVMDLAERTDAPIVVWSFPEARTGANLRLNSLCGANLASYSLRRRSHPSAFVHIDPADPAAEQRAADAIATALSPASAASTAAAREPVGVTAEVMERAAATDSVMRSSRVGVIGDPPVGFEPCIGNPDEIAERFGIMVDQLELDRLFEAARDATSEQVVRITDRISSTMELGDMTIDEIEPSARLYCAMRQHADDRDFGAFATRCWPECMVDFGGAACTPHALMADDGVSGTCEADMLGAITSVMLRSVGDGAAPFIADLVDVDEADGTSVLWHCGVAPPEMAGADQSVEAAVHPNRKVPLVNQFVLRPGRVTIARLSQCGSGYSLVLGGGEMLDRPRPFSGTSGVIRWDQPVADVAATIFGFGVEHHLGIVYGEHQDVLAELARGWGIPVVRLGVDR